MNTIKEALEGAKKHLWDGKSPSNGKEEFICHAACKAAAMAGTSYLFKERVCVYVESKLEGNSTALGLAEDREIDTGSQEALQAFRLAFIDELIAGLEEGQ